MSVRAIEAEVSIKSGVQAECTIGREVIVEVHDNANIESLIVTENGIYTPTDGIDGFNPVTVNVEAPKDPNIIEGEFIGTETDVLTINTGYAGDGYPKVISVYPVSGMMQTDDDYFLNAPRYSINTIIYAKSNDEEPSYPDELSGANNQSRYLFIGKAYIDSYMSSQGSAYTYSTLSNEDKKGPGEAVRVINNHTLKIAIKPSQGSGYWFPAGIRYKYQVVY